MSHKQSYYNWGSTSLKSSHYHSANIVVLVAQLILGAVFIFSGISKSIDPYGTAYKIEEYLYSFGIPANETFSLVIACVLCFGETLLGFLTMAGFYRKIVSKLMFAVMCFMTLLTLYIMIANPVADCGCFGVALKISNSATFIKNLVLMIPATILLLYPDDIWPLLSQKAELIVTIIASVIFIHFISTAILHLPIIDFRPYKVGADLSELKGVNITDIDSSDDIAYVYSKNGEERTFSVDELAQVDSTWTYVRQEELHSANNDSNVPVAKGADFILTNASGADLVNEIIQTHQRAMLIITSDAKKLTDKFIPTIRELKDIASNNNGVLYIAAGNGTIPNEVRRIATDVAHLDYTTAKTIIRSHPALLVIADNKIVRNTSAYDLSRLVRNEKFAHSPFELRSERESNLQLSYRFGLLGLGAICFVVSIIRRAILMRRNRY